MDPIAFAVNDLGEPDAVNPPIRFDEGRRLCAFYSTTPAPHVEVNRSKEGVAPAMQETCLTKESVPTIG